MQTVSAAYKKAVYQLPPYDFYARHFVPKALLSIIDVNARGAISYSAPSSSFVTNFTGLVDGLTERLYTWGTLEDYQFLFNTTGVRLMDSASGTHDEFAFGWMSETMSDANGNINAVLYGDYNIVISTIGRTLYFDPCLDAYPTHFRIQYYNGTDLIDSETVSDHVGYVFSTSKGVTGYNRVVFTFTRMSKPYRRVRLLEDVPGLFVTYTDKEITSLTVSKSVDLFCEELVTSEMDLSVENVSKTLDILNTDGFEKFLTEQQPISVYLNLVFPDDTVEEVLIGDWKLSSWKSNKGSLEATFTIQDALNSLTSRKYYKSQMPTVYKSLYDYAVEVLEDAGITEYNISSTLLNVFTKAPLPVAEHKELLRLIAQAGLCLVIPTRTGGINIVDASPLIYGMNSIASGDFEDVTRWTLSNSEVSTDVVYIGSQSVKLNSGTAYVQQNVSCVSGHTYFVSCRLYHSTNFASTDTLYLRANGTNLTTDISKANVVLNTWHQQSAMYTANTSSVTFDIYSVGAGNVYVDAFMLIDLTLLYGSNMPDLQWCQRCIRFFSTAMFIPRYADPAAVDNLNYRVLIDAPEVEADEMIASVDVQVYGYAKDATVSEVYKGLRSIAGTETFNVIFTAPCDSPVVHIETVDSAGNVLEDITESALLETVFYAQAAELKLKANTTVQVRIEGYKYTVSQSDYLIGPQFDNRLVSGARDITIDNKLITYTGTADNVANYCIFWHDHAFVYDFDWRQNPAADLLDVVTVQDDFDNNNPVTLTELDIRYDNGVLTGSAKGRY